MTAAGWHPGDDVGTGTCLLEVHREATTMTFLAIVACQIGTVSAARVERAPLRAVGFTSNRLVLWGIAFELVFVTLVVAVPPLQAVFGTAVPPWRWLAALLGCPPIVLAADEMGPASARRKATKGPGDGEADVRRSRSVEILDARARPVGPPPGRRSPASGSRR